MKKILYVLVFLTMYAWDGNCQEIDYGSNNGSYITLSDTQIYYEEYGAGTPLLLLHGGFGSISDFQLIIKELSNHFKVIAIDSPGHGRSELVDEMSFDLMASMYSEFIDKLDLESVYVIGYSDGGIVAMLLAAQRPDKVQKIVISGANTNMCGIKPEVLESLQQLSPEIIETYNKEWLTAYQSKSPEKDNWKKYIDDMKKMYAIEEIISPEILAQIKSQVLVVYGDKMLLNWNTVWKSRAIAGSEFCILPDTPHEVFSTKPALINKIVINFFNKNKN